MASPNANHRGSSRLGLAGLLLTGSLIIGSGQSGCETVRSPTVVPNAWSIGGLAAGLVSANNPNIPALGAVRDFANYHGQLGNEAMMQNLRNQGSQPNAQVNIYGNAQGGAYQQAPVYTQAQIDQQRQQSYEQITKKRLREEVFVAFACNYWQDFNNDGKWSSDEFVGIKDKFTEQDGKITLVYKYSYRGQNGNLNMKLFDYKDGSLVDENNRVVSKGDKCAWFWFDSKKLAPRRYSVVWTLDGKVLDKPFIFDKEGELKPAIKYFVCNRWEDKDGNGIVSSMQEFVNVKERFSAEEDLAVIAMFSNAEGKLIRRVIRDQQNNVVDRFEDRIPHQNGGYGLGKPGDRDIITMEDLLKKGGTGKYRVEYYLDSNFEGVCEFEIYGELPEHIKKAREGAAKAALPAPAPSAPAFVAPAAPAVPASRMSAAEIEKELEIFKRMRDRGDLTEEEYQLKRKALVSRP